MNRQKVWPIDVYKRQDMVAVVNHHKVGSTEFIIPDNKLYVVAANDKFIKFVTTGESYILSLIHI